MTLEQRIQAFHLLGEHLRTLPKETLENWCDMARAQNAWFSKESVILSLSGISKFLEKSTLENWTSRYHIGQTKPRTIATILAGNLPLVGFHDILSVLICGHALLVKLSSKDTFLIKTVLKKLVEIEPAFEKSIQYADVPMRGFYAVIATGSDNSSRYFNHYFGKYPSIIRKNRTSCAIITGFETSDEMKELGKDVFSYFGLGCRNVSKLYVPQGFDFQNLLDSWSIYSNTIDHHKFNNNYDYQKAILLVNQQPHLDTGYVLLSESLNLVSPIAVLYYQVYTSKDDLTEKIKENRSKIQCIVGSSNECTVAFGQTQQPHVDEYADDVDTLAFLTSLN